METESLEVSPEVWNGYDDKGNLHGAVIDNCYVSGSIYHESDNGDNYVGGIVGWQKKGAVINCKSDVVVSCYVSDQDKIAAAAGIAGVLDQGFNCKFITMKVLEWYRRK